MPKGPKYVDFTITPKTSNSDFISFLCRAESASTGSTIVSTAVTTLATPSTSREVEQENIITTNNNKNNKNNNIIVERNEKTKKQHRSQKENMSSQSLLSAGNNSNNNNNKNKVASSSSLNTLHKSNANLNQPQTLTVNSATVVIVCLYGITHASPSILSTLMDVLTFAQVSLRNGRAAALPSLRIVAFCDYRLSAIVLPIYIRSAFTLSMYMSALAMESVAVLQSTDLSTSNVVNKRHMMMLMALTNANLDNTAAVNQPVNGVTSSNSKLNSNSNNSPSSSSSNRRSNGADAIEYKYKLIDSVTVSSSVARYLRHLLLVVSGSMYSAQVIGSHWFTRLPHYYRVLKVIALLFDPDKSSEDVWDVYSRSNSNNVGGAVINDRNETNILYAPWSNQAKSELLSPQLSPQQQRPQYLYNIPYEGNNNNNNITTNNINNTNGNSNNNNNNESSISGADSVHTTPSTMAAAPVMPIQWKQFNALDEPRLTNGKLRSHYPFSFSHIVVSPSDVISLLSTFCTHLLALSRYELPSHDILHALLYGTKVSHSPSPELLPLSPSSVLPTAARLNDNNYDKCNINRNDVFVNATNDNDNDNDNDDVVVVAETSFNRQERHGPNAIYESSIRDKVMYTNEQDNNNSNDNDAGVSKNNSRHLREVSSEFAKNTNNDVNVCNTDNRKELNYNNKEELFNLHCDQPYDSVMSNRDNDQHRLKTIEATTNNATSAPIKLPEMYMVHKQLFNDHSTWDIRAASHHAHLFNKHPILQRTAELFDLNTYHNTEAHSIIGKGSTKRLNEPSKGAGGSIKNSNRDLYGLQRRHIPFSSTSPATTSLSQSMQSVHVPYATRYGNVLDTLNYCETREVIRATLLCRSSPAPGERIDT